MLRARGIGGLGGVCAERDDTERLLGRRLGEEYGNNFSIIGGSNHEILQLQQIKRTRTGANIPLCSLSGLQFKLLNTQSKNFRRGDKKCRDIALSDHQTIICIMNGISGQAVTLARIELFICS
jgi:hypothetical protein